MIISDTDIVLNCYEVCYLSLLSSEVDEEKWNLLVREWKGNLKEIYSFYGWRIQWRITYSNTKVVLDSIVHCPAYNQ